MEQQRIFIGYKKISIGSEEFIAFFLVNNPNKFDGECYEITSDSGEGSFSNILVKIRDKITAEHSQKGESKNE